jgi:multimeric flavodoxin WrbA
MRAVILNCTLKKSPEESNTESLAKAVAAGLADQGAGVDWYRVVDYNVPPGVVTDLGAGDQWPQLHDALLGAEILVIATPTWVGHPSSIAQRVIERMDAMISETTADGVPVAYNRVAGVVVTGNEDGAHHVISEICGALGDIGYTIPGQAWTYWNMGPGPGPQYSETDHGHEWAHKTAGTMAHNLFAVASALKAMPVK